RGGVVDWHRRDSAPGRQRSPAGHHNRDPRGHPCLPEGGVMSAILVLLLGAIGTYLLRLLFITLIPAHRLPDRARAALQLVGPAALAALIATDIGHAAAHPANL